jgi:hypothetical protein
VSFANSSDIALASGPGGTNLYIYETRTAAVGETGHTISQSGVGYVYKQSATTTAFATDYVVGDFLTIDSSLTKQIISIANNDFMTVSAPFNSDVSNKTHKKTFPAKIAIPFNNRTNRSITALNNFQSISLNLGEYISSSFDVQIDASVNRGAAKSIKKQVNKEVYVKIDCNTHQNGNKGPWSLGMPDALSIKNIYVDQTGSSYSINNVNYANNFILDNGQKDAHYDLASIKLKTGSFGLANTAKLLVKLAVFTREAGEGVGFFTCNSYPIDDTNYNATTTISTIDIPQFISTDGVKYDLRDVVDFRPYADASATVTSTIASSTINPTSTLSFSATTPYLPKPESFTCSP